METAEAVQDPLHLVLVHLNGPDGDKQLYRTVARAFHRSCKQYQASARATIRHLSLSRYSDLVRYHRNSFPHPWEAAIPVGLLLASPAVSSLSLAAEQLEPLAQLLEEPAVQAMMAQLKHLKVSAWPSMTAYGVRSSKALGQLLWACRKLENVDLHLWRSIQQPWLLLDPDSTSISTAMAPPLPLRSLKVWHMPVQLINHYVAQQQQQLGNSLHHMKVYYSSGEGQLDAAQLTGLRALDDLQLVGTDITGAAHMDTMSGLTQLQLTMWHSPAAAAGAVAAAEAALRLTNLQHLSIGGSLTELPGATQVLKHLTCLGISNSYIEQLPEDLGEWCPGLVRLDASDSRLAAVPASVGCLTWLDLSLSRGEQLVLPTTLTRLKELHLANAAYDAMTGISSLGALEQLVACAYNCPADEYYTLGGSLAELAPLTRLRHLHLHEAYLVDPGSFTAIGALQQLTYLHFGSIRRDWDEEHTASGWEVLGASEPLLALQQLDLSENWGQRGKLATLGPWLSRLSALTQLNVSHCTVSTDDELLYLPHQLLELNVSMLRLQRMPLGLQPLSQLQKLHIGFNEELSELPEWFSELQSLAWMDVYGTGLISDGEPHIWLITH